MRVQIIAFVANACIQNSVAQGLGCDVTGEFLAMNYYSDAIFGSSFVTPRGAHVALVFSQP